MGSYHFLTIGCRRRLNICFSCTKGECYRHGLCSACGRSVFALETNWFREDSQKQFYLLLLLFAHFSLGFAGKHKTARSPRENWEGEILWTSGKYRTLRNENIVENVLENLTNTNFNEVCGSLSGEGSGQPLLLSVVVSEVMTVWWVLAGEILQFWVR